MTAVLTAVKRGDTGAAGVSTELSFQVHWATCPEDIAEAQRLRFRVFVGEMGANLCLAANVPPAHDVDPFDAYCDHLVVRARDSSGDGRVIATCRVLTPEDARRAGGLYTDREFDLEPVRELLLRAIEMGRVCIDPSWRNGLVVMAMWRAVGLRMAAQNLEAMIGCSSVSLSDGGRLASQLWHRLRMKYLVPSSDRVRPRVALHLTAEDALGPDAAVPTLMKGYLRCGGRFLGPPALDRAFNTADFPMIMRLDDLPTRYARRVFVEEQ